MSSFDGFPSQTLTFLEELDRNNNKAWFDDHREQYQRYWVDVGKEFVVAAGIRLAAIRPGVVADPRVNGSMFRINRDVRFSQDKTPYKDHLDVWFWEGERRNPASSFFFRLTPDIVMAGAGAHVFDRDKLARYRRAVQDPRKAEALTAIAAAIDDGIGGDTLKRAPRGTPADLTDDQQRLMRYTTLFSMAERPPGPWVMTSEVLDWTIEQWRQRAPLHEWLVENTS